MAERKRWDKQPDFQPSRVDSTSDVRADPVLTKQLQYIKVLEERNRVKKRLAAASKRNDRLHEREEAFVTAFNVPTRVASSSSSSSRNIKSSTSVLPTKLPGKREDSKLSKCRSAPSTTLNFATGGDEKTVAKNQVQRAKWNRPQAPMEVAVEHQDGVPLFRLTTQTEVEEKEEDENEEESYLEESFEEFEDDEDRDVGYNVRGGELVINDIEEEEEIKHEAKASSQSETLHALNSPIDFSKTTKELFGIIQHLSRSKQRKLVNVLQHFQSSEQDENDVKVLQSSIGDPAIWKEITSVLNTPSASPPPSNFTADNDVCEIPTVVPLKNLLEEQIRLEDEYANEVKQRIAREREEKNRILKKAEERRAKMMKELEDEEREIEQLMEIKRKERLIKLRALQEEEHADTSKQEKQSELFHESSSKLESEQKLLEGREKAQTNADLSIADAKESIFSSPAAKKRTLESDENFQDAKILEEQVLVVPPLNLNFNSGGKSLDKVKHYELHVKLLSTWSKTRAIGLTQICVYDLNGEELSVNMETLQLYNQQTGKPLPKTNDMVRGLQKLFNGITQTNIEKEMWLGRLGDSGILLIKFEVFSTPSKLCIWNFNSRLHTACARDIEVLVNEKSVWTGSLPETFGDQDDNICTWIDLLGSRKTARTARLDESSVLKPNLYTKTSEHWTEALKSGRRVVTQVEQRNEETPTEGTPLWLENSLSSLLSTERSALTCRSGDEFETIIADEKPSLGSRRRQNKAIYGKVIEDSSTQADKKTKSNNTVDHKYEKVRDERKENVPALASLSSWDSLENFSKTNRSRLPLSTDTAIIPADESCEAKAKPAYSRISFTTSALLSELRQGPSMTNYTSVSGSELPASFEAKLFADSKTPSNSVIEAIKSGTVTDIPVLPSGKWLQMEILSTWGDPYYVGLNGVEIFDHRGELVRFQDPMKQITACPESINVLEENSDDPRVPKNLVDGVNFTCDDFHMWLAPFTSGQIHYVLIEFSEHVSVSMVRLWNYNKSRTHTCRGVREARLILYDTCPVVLLGISSEAGNVIFEGEIRQAPGLVRADSMDSSNEVILFTQETTILKAIEVNDEALRAISQEQQCEEDETQEIMATVHHSMELRRPRTSDAGSHSVQENELNRQSGVEKDGRPMTMATRSLADNSVRLRTSIDSWVVEEPQQNSPDSAKTLEENSNYVEEKLPYGRRLTLQLHSTWGDQNYIGLTQVEVLVGSRGTPIPLDIANIDASPRDLASLGYIGDPRTLDKLIDGEVTTCDDTHMWLVPMEVGALPEIHIEFKKPQYFFGLRIWNYNKSTEDTYRGVKQLAITLDGVFISPKDTGFLLRKAPGVADFNFGQLVKFPQGAGKEFTKSVAAYSERIRNPFNTRAYKTPIIRQDYETPLYPQGFLLKIVCWTAWGDPYYLGLNGLELYDFAGAQITEKPTIITAVPYSVSELDITGRQQDARTPENLLSGLEKNTWEAHDSWLAPLASSLGNYQGNIVYIGFDSPIVLSMIKFWNYSKTPERGVKDLDIYLDDLQLFSGTLRKAPIYDDYGANTRVLKMHKIKEAFGQPVLFSASQAQVDGEKRYMSYCGTEEQDVLGINEGQVMEESRAMYRKPDPGAEGVVVDLESRPMTAVCRQ